MGSTDAERESRAQRWHQSGLAQITGCSRQWYLENVKGWRVPEKVTTITGTAYHLATEAHQKARLDGTAQPDQAECTELAVAETLRLAELADPVALDAFTSGKATGTQALVQDTEIAVDNYFNADLAEGPPLADVLNGWTPVALEEYLSAEFVEGARQLGGTVDGVFTTPTGQLVVADHKTTGANIKSVWGKPGHGAAQATHYSVLAVLNGLTEELPPMHFLVTRRSPARADTEKARVVTYQPTANDVAQLATTVRHAEDIVAKGVFAPNPSWQWCRDTSCFFYRECQVTGQLAGPVSTLPG